MLRKLSLFFALAIFLVPALPVTAAVAPEFNPICWKKAQCETQRKLISKDAAGEGFLPNEAPCTGGDDPVNDPWGKCLPGTVVRTEIRFGGVSQFTGMGDFIKMNYNLAIGIAGILAAIVIVMAGFQWAASGGNADTISKAKKRIFGAVTGLLIAYSSYIILSTINPDLVSLRLPQAYMVKPGNIIPRVCSVASKTSMFTKVAEASDQTTAIRPDSTRQYDLDWDDVANPDYAPGSNCGARYSIENTDSVCFGDICPPSQTCINIHASNPANTNYSCEPGSIFGIVTNSGSTGCVAKYMSGVKTFSYRFISNDSDNGIYKVCKDNGAPNYSLGEGPITRVGGSISDVEDKKQQYFSISKNGEADSDCGQNSTFLGYALGLDLAYNCSVSTERHLIDKNGKDLGVFSDVGVGMDPAVSGYFINTNANMGVDNLISAEELNRGGIVILVDTANFQQQQ